MSAKDNFLDIYTSTIARDGADKMLEYLESSDFFTAPASTRFHGSHPGGLVEHCVNVYEALSDYVNRPRAKEVYGMNFSDETIAIVALLHDVCKIGCYKPSTRNVKKNGKWEEVPYYEFDDPMPYGHGEKSVYIINGYMRLKREEAFAIRYHMGFAGIEDKNTIGNVFEKFPLAYAMFVADMEATYYLEEKN
ncbi:MAG: hydrolase [Ruminococcaceae bacterium]|nr:hydrolase [Oscillospiraceae bacterium]